MTTRHARIGALGIVAAAMLLGACKDDGGAQQVATLGDGSAASADGDSRPSERDAEKAMLAFSKCMRENGIDMPDPSFEGGSGGRGMIRFGGPAGALDASPEEMEAAHKACEKHLPKGLDGPGGDPEQEAKLQEQMLAFAKCMREHGIDMPDPQVDGGRVQVLIGKDGMDPEDPEFRAAEEACDEHRPGGPDGARAGRVREERR